MNALVLFQSSFDTPMTALLVALFVLWMTPSLVESQCMQPYSLVGQGNHTQCLAKMTRNQFPGHVCGLYNAKWASIKAGGSFLFSFMSGECQSQTCSFGAHINATGTPVQPDNTPLVVPGISLPSGNIGEHMSYVFYQFQFYNASLCQNDICEVPLGCQPGAEEALVGQVCDVCEVGEYKSTFGTHDCSPCPDGFACPNEGTVLPVAAPPGYLVENGELVECNTQNYFCAHASFSQQQRICEFGFNCHAGYQAPMVTGLSLVELVPWHNHWTVAATGLSPRSIPMNDSRFLALQVNLSYAVDIRATLTLLSDVCDAGQLMYLPNNESFFGLLDELMFDPNVLRLVRDIDAFGVPPYFTRHVLEDFEGNRMQDVRYDGFLNGFQRSIELVYPTTLYCPIVNFPGGNHSIYAHVLFNGSEWSSQPYHSPFGGNYIPQSYEEWQAPFAIRFEAPLVSFVELNGNSVAFARYPAQFHSQPTIASTFAVFTLRVQGVDLSRHTNQFKLELNQYELTQCASANQLPEPRNLCYFPSVDQEERSLIHVPALPLFEAYYVRIEYYGLVSEWSINMRGSFDWYASPFRIGLQGIVPGPFAEGNVTIEGNSLAVGLIFQVEHILLGSSQCVAAPGLNGNDLVNYITCTIENDLVEPFADLSIYLLNGSSFAIDASIPPYAVVSNSMMGALDPTSINNVVLQGNYFGSQFDIAAVIVNGWQLCNNIQILTTNFLLCELSMNGAGDMLSVSIVTKSLAVTTRPSILSYLPAVIDSVVIPYVDTVPDPPQNIIYRAPGIVVDISVSGSRFVEGTTRFVGDLGSFCQGSAFTFTVTGLSCRINDTFALPDSIMVTVSNGYDADDERTVLGKQAVRAALVQRLGSIGSMWTDLSSESVDQQTSFPQGTILVMGAPVILGVSRAQGAVGDWLDIRIDQIHDPSHVKQIGFWAQQTFFACNSIIRVNASFFQCQIPNLFGDLLVQVISAGIQVTNVYNVANARPFPIVDVTRVTQNDQPISQPDVGGNVVGVVGMRQPGEHTSIMFSWRVGDQDRGLYVDSFAVAVSLNRTALSHMQMTSANTKGILVRIVPKSVCQWNSIDTEFACATVLDGLAPTPYAAIVAPMFGNRYGQKSRVSDDVVDACIASQYFASHLPREEQQCLECPQGGVCTGGNHTTLGVMPGYWRVEWVSSLTEFVQCKWGAACPGTSNATGVDRAIVCSPGYMGPLCSVCAPGYGPDRWVKFACVPCTDDTVTLLVGIAFFICIIVMFLFAIRSALRTNPYENAQDGQRAKFVAVLKLLISHMQQSAIFFAFDVKWPEAVESMFSFFEGTANVGERALSLQCVLRGSSGIGSHPFYTRTMFMYMIPIVIVAVSILAWMVAAKLKRAVRVPFDFQSIEKDMRRTEQLSFRNPIQSGRASMVRQDSSLSSALSSEIHCGCKRAESINRDLFRVVQRAWFRILPDPYGTFAIATVLATASLVYVAMNDAVLSIFSCSPVHSKRFLDKSFDIDCTSSSHLTMQLTLGLAGVLIFSLGTPLLFSWIVRMERDNFENPMHIAHYRYAFIVSGYRRETRYWESIVMLQKLALAVIGRVVKQNGLEASILAGFFFFLIVWFLHESFLPYSDKRLNTLVRLSLLTICVTYLGCVAMVFEPDDETLHVMVSLGIILFNICFFVNIAHMMVRSMGTLNPVQLVKRVWTGRRATVIANPVAQTIANPVAYTIADSVDQLRDQTV